MIPKAGRRAFYAVAKGRQTGVFNSWSECERVVKGFQGARYKKFDSREGAEAFARGEAVAGAATGKAKKAKGAGGVSSQLPAGVLAVFTDGGCRGNQRVDVDRFQPAGWGFVAVRDGSAVAERWGPVEVDAASPAFLGAEKCSNNTGELSAIGEALLWLRDEDRKCDRAVLCYDSKYAANITDGTYRAHKNVDLAKTCQALFASERARRQRGGGGLDLRHVKGHSGDAFNDRADALVQRGINGTRSGRGADAPAPEGAARADTAPGPTTAPAAAAKPPIDAETRAAIARKREEALAKRAATAAAPAPTKRQKTNGDVVDLTGSP